MTTAIATTNGKVRQLDRPAQPDELVTEEDASSALKLSKLLVRLLRHVALLRRRFSPAVIVYEDIPTSTLGAKVTLEHGFGGRVRWSVVGWQSSGTTAVNLKEDTTSTDADTLVLLSYTAGTACIRVEEAG